MYAGALKAHEGDSVTVRLTTSVRVTVRKVALNLGVKLQISITSSADLSLFVLGI